jgi:phage FluMu protein Com
VATAWFGPCPHCNSALSYLEGVTGSTLHPSCPRCKLEVAVERATFLMADYSRPTPYAKPGRKRARVNSSPETT